MPHEPGLDALEQFKADPKNSPAPLRLHFVATLVFDAGRGRRHLEPHVFPTSHPEIAYQLALRRAAEGRYGRTFVGIAELEETAEDVPTVGNLDVTVVEEF